MKKEMSTMPVVVGYDETAQGRAAMMLAAQEAAVRRLPLRVVYARDLPVWANPVAMPPYRPSVLGSGDGTETAVRTAAAELRQAFPTVEIALSGSRETLAAALIRASAQAALLFVGRSDRTGAAGLLTAPVHAQVTRRASSPVVVTGADTDVTGGPVTLAVAGADVPGDAVAFAFEEAAVRREPLVACRVRPETQRAGEAPADRDGLRLTAALDAAADRYPRVPFEQLTLAAGDIAAGPVPQLAEAGLLVTGTPPRHRFGYRRSIHRAILQHLRCPVATIGVNAAG